MLPGTSLYGKSGPKKILFIENKGQWGDEASHAADIPGGKLFLHPGKISYHFFGDKLDAHSRVIRGLPFHTPPKSNVSIINVEFKGANPQSRVVEGIPRKERYNYYLGKNPSRWAEDCSVYEKVVYEDLYKGIDWQVYSMGPSVKYDLIVHPGADPSQIKLAYKGQSALFLEDGCAFSRTGPHTIMENRPIAYQLDDMGKKQMIDCSYSLQDNQISFQLSKKYDPHKKLIIDPELIFSTFSGSVSDNFGYTACFDDQGNLYSGGIVFGPNFPGSSPGSYGGGFTDMAIMKFDSTGSELLYGTFIGGSSLESPHSLVVNHQNELVILGTTGSADFPMNGSPYDDTFNGGTSFYIFGEYTQGADLVIATLDENGHLKSSTFMGSAGNDGILKMKNVGQYTNILIRNYGDFQRGDIIVDDDDNVFVASSTDTTGFPIMNAVQSSYSGGYSDAVVFSLNSDLSQLRWSTYLGGSNDDAAYSIKLNNTGHVLVGGGTASNDFPSTSGALNNSYQNNIDGFITIIDPENDSITHSTFLGTMQYDQVYFIDIDGDQNIYAAGQTRGPYPVTSGVYNNPNSGQFIHKLDPTLSTTIFSTVFGSGVMTPNISLTAFLANECENIFLSGWGGEVNINYSDSGTVTHTFGMPVTNDALYPNTDSSDFYLMALSADGKELLYASFFGSTNSGGDHVDGGTSRFDKRGIIYQSVCSCGGSGDNFPTTPGAWSRVNRGVNASGIERCNNASFKFDLASLRARFETNGPLGDNPGLQDGCTPLSIVFTNTSLGGKTFEWYFGDGNTSHQPDTVTHTYEAQGTYTVTLIAKDESTCNVEDSVKKVITVRDEQVSVIGPQQICVNTSVQLYAEGGATYLWQPAVGLDDPTSPTPLASPTTSTSYTVLITTPGGCELEQTVDVEVVTVVEENFEVIMDHSCGKPITFQIENQTDYDGPFLWDFGDGQTSSEKNPEHLYSTPGQYTINLEVESPCFTDHKAEVVFGEIFIPNVFTPNDDGINDLFEIQSPYDFALHIMDRTGKEVYFSEHYHNEWDGDDLTAGVYFYQTKFAHGETCKGWVQLMR